MKKPLVEQLKLKLFLIKNQLKNYTNQLFKPIIADNIWCEDLADMLLISKFNKGFGFPLCFIDIYNKYPWVIPLKDKKRNYNY